MAEILLAILILVSILCVLVLAGVTLGFLAWRRQTSALEYLETVEEDTRAIKAAEEKLTRDVVAHRQM